jgi:hypothetical protein
MTNDDRLAQLETEVARIKSEHEGMLRAFPLDARDRIAEMETTLELSMQSVDSRIVELSHHAAGSEDVPEEIVEAMLEIAKTSLDSCKLLAAQIRQIRESIAVLELRR